MGQILSQTQFGLCLVSQSWTPSVRAVSTHGTLLKLIGWHLDRVEAKDRVLHWLILLMLGLSVGFYDLFCHYLFWLWEVIVELFPRAVLLFTCFRLLWNITSTQHFLLLLGWSHILRSSAKTFDYLDLWQTRVYQIVFALPILLFHVNIFNDASLCSCTFSGSKWGFGVDLVLVKNIHSVCALLVARPMRALRELTCPLLYCCNLIEGCDVIPLLATVVAEQQALVLLPRLDLKLLSWINFFSSEYDTRYDRYFISFRVRCFLCGLAFLVLWFLPYLGVPLRL